MTEKHLNIQHQGNVTENYFDFFFHFAPARMAKINNKKWQLMLARMWNKGISPPLLVENENLKSLW